MFYKGVVTPAHVKKGNLMEFIHYESPYTLPNFTPLAFRQLTDRYFENRPYWLSSEFDSSAWRYVRAVEHRIAQNHFSLTDVCCNYQDAILKCKNTFKTSPGYPYTEVFNQKFTSPDSFSNDMDFWVREAEKLRLALESGTRPVVFNLFLKDELVKKSKLLEGKQRGICGASFNFIILQTFTLEHHHEATIRGRLDAAVPYALGLDVTGEDWSLRCLMHKKFSKHWCSDVSGLEFVVPDGMYRQLYRIYEDFVPMDRLDLHSAIADQLSEYVVRGDRVDVCVGGTPSGHKGTSQDNSRLTFHLLVVVLLEQGLNPTDFQFSIQGDDAWISTNQLFDPVRAKKFAAELGVTLKGSDQLVDFCDVEFLSRTPKDFRGEIVSVCSKDRREKLKHSSYVFNKKLGFRVVTEKFCSLLFSECFDDEMWNFLLLVYEKYPLLEKMEFVQWSMQCKRLKLQGLVKEPPLNRTLCMMAKTASQKLRAKARKNGKVKVKGKINLSGKSHRPELVIKNPLANNVVRPVNKYPKGRVREMKMDPTVAQAKEYVLALREPRIAYENSLTPAPPDLINKPLYRFGSSTVGNSTSVANGSTLDIWVQAQPFGSGQVAIAATYSSGKPATFTTSNVSNYAQWASFINQIRCVAMQIEIWNTTKVSDESGITVLWNGPNDNATTLAFSDINGSNTTCVKAANDLKVKSISWAPVMDDTTGDFALKEPNATTAGFPQATCLTFWLQSGTAQSVSYRITAMWEAEILIEYSTFLRPMVKASSWENVNRELFRLNSSDPVYSSAHVDQRDLKSEMKTIFPKTKSKFRRMAEILGEVSVNDIFESAMGYFGGSGSSSWSGFSSDERLRRLIHQMNDQDVTNLVKLLRDAPTKEVLIARMEDKCKPRSSKFVLVEEKG